MKNKHLLGFFVIVFLGCTSHYKYWDISKFNIEPNSLHDKEEIKVIYTSQGPDYNPGLSYFIHLIVVSQETGDTVNVLTTINNGLQEHHVDQVFNFINQDNPMASLIHSDLENIDNAGQPNSLQKPDLKGIKKVARDPNFDYIADNHYPSVIGWVGTVSGADK